MRFAQPPVLLRAYFDLNKAFPVVSMVACITGGHEREGLILSLLACQAEKVTQPEQCLNKVYKDKGLQGFTMVAYSPRLWLIGRW
eukprot:24430-Pelagomonas_calceolata.AAC.1